MSAGHAPFDRATLDKLFQYCMALCNEPDEAYDLLYGAIKKFSAAVLHGPRASAGALGIAVGRTLQRPEPDLHTAGCACYWYDHNRPNRPGSTINHIII